MGDVRPVLPKPRADRLVEQLELTLEGVRLACLGFVSFPLDEGARSAVVQGAVRRLTPDLWADGLHEQAFEAVRRDERLLAAARTRLDRAPPDLN